jgi:alkylation response protein AidB-like acyl-CoA dehydrogenase
LSQAVLADRPVAQIELARQETAFASARAFLYGAVEDLWQTVNSGGSLTPNQLAFNRMAAINATETGAAVTRAASALAGGSAIYTSASMQRHVRDAEAVTHHFTVAPHVWEDAGRVLMGRQPTAPIF